MKRVSSRITKNILKGSTLTDRMVTDSFQKNSIFKSSQTNPLACWQKVFSARNPWQNQQTSELCSKLQQIALEALTTSSKESAWNEKAHRSGNFSLFFYDQMRILRVIYKVNLFRFRKARLAIFLFVSTKELKEFPIAARRINKTAIFIFRFFTTSSSTSSDHDLILRTRFGGTGRRLICRDRKKCCRQYVNERAVKRLSSSMKKPNRVENYCKPFNQAFTNSSA